MGVYSDKQIKEAIKTGHIVFHPYNEKHIQGSSVDVTLGEWYFRPEKNRRKGIYNPFDRTDVDGYFDGPHRAMPHAEWCEKNDRTLFEGIPEDHPIIVLQPGERILAHTHEFIGIKAPGTSTMQARSSWGRNGVAVCLDAGWGDPGYINRWTMEVYNMNQYEAVVLPAGERVAQMVFYETGEVESEYSTLTGKYQDEKESEFKDLIKNWKPEHMLPRAYKDNRKLPVLIDGLSLPQVGVGEAKVVPATATAPTQIKEIIEDKQKEQEKPAKSDKKAQKTDENPYVTKNDEGQYEITEAGKEYLKDAVTDADGDIYAFTDKLSNSTIAAAMARLSRRADDMRITILDEFATHEGKDEGLLKRVITAYGDDSVQQLAGLHFVFEGASNLLTKKLEWGRLAAYLEQSTRYIYFDKPDEKGNYRYFTPKTLDAKTAKMYEEKMDEIFEIYSDMVRKLTKYVRSNSNVPKKEQDVAWKGATRAQACDAIREVLPVSTKSTVGIFASGQALENLIMHLMSDPLEEARSGGQILLEQARQVVPTFLERADRPDRGGAMVAYRANTYEAMKKISDEKLPQNLSPETDEVTLVDFWPRNELDALPHMLFEHSSLPLEQIENEVNGWSYEDKVKAFNTYMGERLNRRHKPGRAMEQAHYSWELVCDYGIFRDLQRHRMVDDLQWQELSPRYGYDVPELVEEAGLTEDFQKCFDISYQLYSDMQASGHQDEAQYATLMGHKMRWKIMMNARQSFHFNELRTSPQGHPGYRRLVKAMHDKLAEVHPLTAASMTFVNQDEDPELTRLAAERATQYKLAKLDKKV